MSELKVYHHELRHNEYEEFYLKYEADKVIAELKADYKEACDRLQTANLIKDEQLAETRRQKYKRCLRNAEGCKNKAWFYGEVHDRNAALTMWKWRKRWLELAEKFKDKEAKRCAEVPEKPAPRIATNRELAKWLAQGKGEWCNCIGDNQRAAIEWWYDQGYSEKAAKNVFVRKWDDTEWHEPDVEYIGIADVTTFEDVVKREG